MFSNQRVGFSTLEAVARAFAFIFFGCLRAANGVAGPVPADEWPQWLGPEETEPGRQRGFQRRFFGRAQATLEANHWRWVQRPSGEFRLCRCDGPKSGTGHGG